MAGQYLIIDLLQEPPSVVNADDILPAAIQAALADILSRLTRIEANQETIMSDMAAEQQTINDLATAVTAVAGHVSSASATLSQWIADHQSAPLDFTPALNALSSLQAADTTLAGVVPQAPAQPLDTPVPDPGTPPAADQPVDPANPPDLPAGGDVSVATDPGTSADAAAADTPAVDTGSPDAAPSF